MKTQKSYPLALWVWSLCVLGMLLTTPPIVAQTGAQIKVPEEIARSILNENDNGECLQQNGGVEKNLTARLTHLSRDGGSQILVQGAYPCFCGAQNCSFWIYRKAVNGYELLLAIDGAVNVAPKNAFTSGYGDISASSHSSGFETYVRTYKFDGRQYQIRDCVIRSYLDQNGRQLKRPIFMKCD